MAGRLKTGFMRGKKWKMSKKKKKITYKTQVNQYLRRKLKETLTAIVIERGEFGLFLCTASTVAHSHLQLVPGGLLEVIEDVGLGQGCPLGCCPDRGPKGSVLQGEGGDGAAAVVPADQVQPHPRGVDAGKELLLLGKLWL